MSARLLLLILLTLAGSAATAAGLAEDSHAEGSVMTVGDAQRAMAIARQAQLFGALEANGSRLQGEFVHAEWDARNGTLRDIHIGAHRVLASVKTPLQGAEPETSGPAAVWRSNGTSLVLHDNPHGWLSMRGATTSVVLHPDPGVLVDLHDPQRATLRMPNLTLSLIVLQGRVVEEGAEGLVLQPDEAPLAFALFVSPDFELDAQTTWIRAAREQDNLVAEVLSLGFDARLRSVAQDRAELAVAGAGLVLFESAGVFTPDAIERYVVHSDLSYPRNQPLERVLQPGELPTAYNVSGVGGDSVRFVVASRDESPRVVVLERDATPPALLGLTEENLSEPFDPRNVVPMLVTRTDEPALGRLVVTTDDGGTYQRPTVLPAFEQRFRLGGLKPDVRYDYEIQLTDLAGNVRTERGSFTTPPAVEGRAPRVEVLEPAMDGQVLPVGPVRVRVLALDAEGAPLAEGRYAVILDKTPSSALVQRDGDELILHLQELAPGSHELVIEGRDASGATTMTRRVFVVEEDRPVPPVSIPAVLAALAALALLGRHGRLA